MSNYLAIATVTAVLQRTLQMAVQRDIEGARVTTVRPNHLGSGTPETGVNLFLYQVMRNTALKTGDAMPSSRTRGSILRQQTPLELYYMLSMYGSEIELEPQRLLGSVVRTLSDQSILAPELIQTTIADPTFAFLAPSNLADQVHQLTVTPVDMTLEEVSKAWSVFFQMPYLLSVAYRVRVVLIDGEESGQRALPVRDRHWGNVMPFANQPVVEQIEPQAGPLRPIVADSTIRIRGRQLRSTVTRIRIGDIETTPTEISETQILVSLNQISIELLRAGVQSLQVIHHITKTNYTDTVCQVESNALPFILRPTLKTVRVVDVNENDSDQDTTEIAVQLNLLVGPKQRVILILNEWAIDDPARYLFEAQSRSINFIGN
jgi:hypothetical protein